MTTEVAKWDDELVELEGIKIRRHEIDLIKRTIFIGATDDEMALFFWECRRRGVHPFDRMIYPVVRKDKSGNRHVTFQMGIDYLRAAAEETGRYVGQKPVQYGQMVKQGEINVPEWAEALILRKDPESGEVADIPHRAYWKEYYPGEELGFMWRKMPMNQLGKCAEAGALRKAFPRKLGGLYINEEMEQAEAVPFTPIQEPQKKTSPQSEQKDKPKPESAMITIKNVTKQDKKKDGTPMKSPLYIILSDAGTEYKTFSESIMKIAIKEMGTGMAFIVQFEKGAYGNTIIENGLNYIDQSPEDGNAQ
jgi:phage recombination protein Bet